MKPAIVIMGVSGCGKSTLGVELAAALGVPFVEGDGLHPPANVAKMRSGVPLDDRDREPFLRAVAEVLSEAGAAGVVVTCSALKRKYRDLIRACAGEVVFVWPRADRAVIAARLAQRREHYMPATLLDSQLATLEPPAPDEHAIAIDGSAPTAAQVAAVLAALRNAGAQTDGDASMNEPQCDIGLVGLAVMGENLALNMESRGFRVCVHNRTHARVTEFLSERGRGKRFVGALTLQDLVRSLKSPRKILLLIKAGEPVDEMLAELTPLLSPGDIVIDGGNSHFVDTIRRTHAMEAKGFLYVGSGVSGGEEGALRGPSLMPGGSAAAWPHLRPIFEAIAARTPDGAPCCAWMGADGAGHFVKMVHNGIEYGDMQLIGETYDLMRRGLGMSNDEMSAVFGEWNTRELDSYLIEITRDILAFRDEKGEPVLDSILDVAGQKGTGKWTVTAALDAGMPLTLIGEAVFSRCLAARKDERVDAARRIGAGGGRLAGDRAQILDDLRRALYAAKLVSYAQGYQLLRAAAQSHGWTYDFAAIAETWRGGCIIRSAFLGDIAQAFARDPKLVNLLLDPYFRESVASRDAAWRRVVVAAVGAGIPVPATSAALAFWDGYRTERLPANLLQAQRDYFGAHQYERIDRPRGQFFHTNWTGHGGATTSEAYTK